MKHFVARDDRGVQKKAIPADVLVNIWNHRFEEVVVLYFERYLCQRYFKEKREKYINYTK